ncbi:MAG TPA: serine/threonine-protein kinase [Gemmataceae bacterium]|nr:serine/threonine-protein kinase [Gemmataceae bacterium]
MATPKLADFFHELELSGLLESAQLEDLTHGGLNQGEDMLPLARAIIRRGWLTRFQVNQIAAGRRQDLTVGPYRILDRLGEGAMGQVFKAHHAVMNRTVALKVIRKEWLRNANAVGRFYKEIQAAAQLIHPNIVLAYDAGQAGPTHYFAMEYVEGTDLSRLVEQSGPLAVGQACEYIRQAALGLQHAHSRGMVHRDIKPHNLLLAASANGTRESAASLIKILDMGLARLQGTEAKDHGLTQTGTVIGTPDFVAPEQALSSRDADIRSDIYSLGCTLYFLLAGRPPHQAASLTEVLLKHQLHEPTPIEEIREEVPAGVRSVLKKMLAKKPGERYQTPGQVVEALAPYASLDDTEAEFAARRDARQNSASDSQLSETEWNQAPSRSKRGSRTQVLADRRDGVGIGRTLRLLRKNNPALFYGAAGGFILLLILAFVTPVLLARKEKPTNDTAQAATASSTALVEKSPAGQQQQQSGAAQPADRPQPDVLQPADQPKPPALQIKPALQPPPEQGSPGWSEKDIVRRYQGYKDFFWTLAISPDAKRALSVAEKKLVLWDLESGERLKKSELLPGPDYSQMALLPDGVHALLLQNQGALHLWDLEKQTSVARFGETPRSQIQHFALSRDGRRFVAGHHAGWSLWDLQTRQQLKAVELPGVGFARRIAWSSDERILFCTTDDVIKAWDVQRGTELKDFDGHLGPTSCLAVSADGSQLLSGGYQDKKVRLWNVQSGKEIRSIPVDTGIIHLVAFAPDGHRALAHSNFWRKFFVLDLDRGRVTHAIGGSQQIGNGPNGLALSRDGQLLLVTDHTGLSLRKWPAANAKGD